MQKYADGGRSGQSGATPQGAAIVDAAAEEDLFKYTEAGADLVTAAPKPKGQVLV